MDISKSLAALLRDARGNSLPIFAASLVPLLAIVGGGVDAARGYLTKVQLQNACDAGVLAGRRAMAKSGVYGDDEEGKALNMFRANFDSDIVDATDINFDTAAGTEGDVSGTASTEIPTVLMQLFGYYDMAFSVDCTAELQITNTDVMFVLDVTGSMAGSRIVGLRDAVRDFHRTITSSVTDDDVRVRYGFVPYSMTVNAKRLLTEGDMPADFIADTAAYQTRVAQFEDYGYVIRNKTKTDDGAYYEYDRDDCNRSWSEATGTAPGDRIVTNYVAGDWSRRNDRCLVEWDRYRYQYENRQAYHFSGWRYQQADVDVADFKAFGGVSIATNLDRELSYIETEEDLTIVDLADLPIRAMDTSSVTWDGCIEERATVVDEDMDPVPTGATDLDINSAPDSDDTRWKPYLARAVFYRYDYYDGVRSFSNLSSTNNYCPAPMRLFEEVDLTPDTIPAWLETYLNDLTPVGGTYHDIGMIWGGRLASPSGIFASVVNDEPERSVSRHIIFMTDGEMAPETDYYSAYGMEKYDNRVAPRYTNRTELIPYHNARYLAACRAIRDEGYTVWVIGFGEELTDEMRACATGDRAFFSNNSDELRATFRFIASQIADLRLNE